MHIEYDYLYNILESYRKARSDEARKSILTFHHNTLSAGVNTVRADIWDECVEATVGGAGPGVAETLKQYNPHRNKENHG